jgi:hypothetical protein
LNLLLVGHLLCTVKYSCIYNNLSRSNRKVKFMLKLGRGYSTNCLPIR